LFLDSVVLTVSMDGRRVRRPTIEEGEVAVMEMKRKYRNVISSTLKRPPTSLHPFLSGILLLLLPPPLLPLPLPLTLISINGDFSSRDFLRIVHWSSFEFVQELN
jgi:hypothetical protein